MENRFKVKKELIEWAFNITDISTETASKIYKSEKWLEPGFKNYLNPTVKQLGAFAAKVHVPFGRLLQQQVPEPEDIRLAFRTVENAPAKVSLNVQEIIHEMQKKQAWFSSESGFAKERLNFISIAKDASLEETVEALLDYLHLPKVDSARELFNSLRNQISRQGVLVMQKGGVGLGNNRPIDVKELRAFVILDDHAPLIFVNQKDSYTARVFSLVHEFVHILRGSDELLSANVRVVAEERLINQVTAEFLMPELDFKTRFDADNVAKVARYFNVSVYAAFVRAQQLGIIQNIDLRQIGVAEPKIKKESTGGNPYNTALSLNDRRYMLAIIDAQKNGTLLPTKTASLIGISLKMLSKTIDMFNEREAR